MAQDSPPNFDPQFPYSSLVRAADRAKVLDQLVSSIWETALGLKLSPVDDIPEELLDVIDLKVPAGPGSEVEQDKKAKNFFAASITRPMSR